MDKAIETKKGSTIAISETQIETTISNNTKTQKTVMESDGLHIIGQSLAKPITVQVTNMDDELITSIDTDGNDSIGITQDGYKVFVNGKLLGIENSSTNE